MKNGKCRMHGGASIGPKTADGRARIAAARTIHGGYGAAMRAMRARTSTIMARGRVLRTVVKTGFPMEALPPLMRQNQIDTPCNVGDLALMAVPLTQTQARRLVHAIHETIARHEQTRASTPCNVTAPPHPSCRQPSTGRSIPYPAQARSVHTQIRAN